MLSLQFQKHHRNAEHPGQILDPCTDQQMRFKYFFQAVYQVPNHLNREESK